MTSAYSARDRERSPVKILKMRIRCSKAICLLTSENLISSIFSTSGNKGTMINFSVSRPGSTSKPMRACEKKTKP